jgi:8-oxo-dGTP diphosphatase
MANPIFAVATKALIIKDDKLLVIYKTVEEAKSYSDMPNFLTDYEVRRDLPGGGLDFGEAPNDGLLREVKEETGLDIEIIKPTDVWYFIRDNRQVVGITHLCIWKSGEVVLSDEHEAFEWLSKEELVAKSWDDAHRYLLAFE